MRKISKWMFIAAAVGIGLVIISSCAPRQTLTETPPISALEEEQPTAVEKPGGVEFPEGAEIEIVQREIKTIAEGELIKYQDETFYSADDFSVISENERAFETWLVDEFVKEVTGVEVSNCSVDLNPSNRSAYLRCDVLGAMYGEDSYNMHFLLKGTARFGFDLYGFEQHETKLMYEGELNGAPVKITFEFPFAISHCHEHVWPK